MALAPLAGTPRFPWPLPQAAEGAAIGAVDPLRVAAAAARRLGRLVEGVERWQRHPHRRRMAEPRTLWRCGTARLLDPGGAGPAVLVIPSLVNRAYILDLAPDASLLRHLAAQGLRPLLLDWGAPGREERGFGLSDYVARRLLPALDHAAEGGPLALVGYCLGGTLAAAAALHRAEAVARLALIGAPWDFGTGRGTALVLRGLCREAGTERVEAALASGARLFGVVPADLLQGLFAALDPGLALAKFRRFAALDPASAEARRFVELEDWLNDPLPLAGPAARDILVDLHLRNLTGAGRWEVAGQRIRPEAIGAPTLVLASATDRIAPPASTEPLARLIPGARLIRPGTGHVGMVAGSRARTEVWAPLEEFLAAGGPGTQSATG